MRGGSLTKIHNHAKLSPMGAVSETPTTFCQGMNVKICVWLILMPLKKCVTSILTLALVVVRIRDGDTTRRLVNVSSFNTADVREIKTDS